MVISILAAALLLFILLDIMGKVKLTHPLAVTLLLPACLNCVALFPLLRDWLQERLSGGAAGFCLAYAAALGAYFWLRLFFFPVRDGQSTGFRLKFMLGGRVIACAALWGMVLQALFFLFAYPALRAAGTGGAVLAGNAAFAVAGLLILLFWGVLRMFLTSRRLSILRRVVMLFTWWIPLVNLAVLVMACRMVYEEYDFALYKRDLHLTRVESDLCATRYPLVLVHGVLFRDLKYFNYWGRVPKELMRYGAAVYYGSQEAVGTIADNAEDIRRTIERVLEETGSPKVNIIAHSKGGLDARYLITHLHMADKVASLTTMSTPHRGCRFVDLALKMPEGLYRWISNLVDGVFRRMGEEHPDFYNAIRQFSTENSRRFNEETPDDPRVYYQSYMTRMRSMGSDAMLGIPYRLIKTLEGENDGLVSVESAKWGEYRGLLLSRGRRGVSHGDIIDLKREDYRGFDVVESYVEIVSDLKQKGF